LKKTDEEVFPIMKYVREAAHLRKRTKDMMAMAEDYRKAE
jgi:hypothetical protein